MSLSDSKNDEPEKTPQTVEIHSRVNTFDTARTESTTGKENNFNSNYFDIFISFLGAP